MLKWLAVTTRRFAVFAILLMAVNFAVPAVASHVCASASPDAAIAFEIASTAPDDGCVGCPDCGPACAGGCCHAPHPGMAADLMDRQPPVTFQRPSTWAHVLRAPMDRPAGPERPPRA